MSHSLWYNDEQLAGPSCNSTPLSFEVHNPLYKIVLPGCQDPPSHVQPGEYPIPQILQKRSRSCLDTDATDQYVIRPRLHFPGYDDKPTKKMHQFYDRFRHDTYDDHQLNSTILADSPSGSSNAEDLDADLSHSPRSPTRMQHNDFRHDVRAIRLPLYLPEVASSFLSYHSVTPENLTESPSPPREVMPKFEETDDSHLDLTPHVRPQTLSPYAPMPLQPIFHLEPQFKTLHDAIEPMPYGCSPLRDAKRTKSPSIAIDPLLIPHHEEAPGPVGVPFARGSIAPRGLWPPSSPTLKSPEPNHRDFCFPTAIDIPLDVAKHYAQEFRASSPHTQLSQQFLLSFMGQAVGNLPWSCYIRGCGKQLTRKSHMVDHIRMHLDERVYACEYCFQTFLRKADCKRHSVAHNPEKAFQCDLCRRSNKSFGRKDLLTRHKRKCESNFRSPSGHTPSQKRKGMRGNSVISTRGTQNAVYVADRLISIPPEQIKRNKHGFILESNEGNKENVPPSSEERLRKKARAFF